MCSKGLLCLVCGARRTQLSRMFGNFPIPQFSSLPPPLQVDFWRSSHTVVGGDAQLARPALSMFLSRVITSSRVDIERDLVSGTFLPLAVWETKGFDVSHIKAKGEYAFHEVLGDTYRVDLKTVETEHIKKTVDNELIELADRAKKDRANKGKAPTKRARSSSSSDSESKSKASSKESSDSESKPKASSKELTQEKKRAEKQARRMYCTHTSQAVSTARCAYYFPQSCCGVNIPTHLV